MTTKNTGLSTRKVPFRVSARTARLIGRENVANAEAAVIELVKNAYDADSTHVSVIFKEQDLYIVDSGHGMSEETIESHWMVIGTDNKQVNPRTNKNRVKSGAKGIGRFALDKLGEDTTLYTIKDNEDVGVRWDVSWPDFEASDKTVDNINAELSIFERQDFENLYKELTGRRVSSGVIFKLQNLRDTWEERHLDRLFESLRALVPPLNDGDFSIELKSDKYPLNYGEVLPSINSNFDYALDAKFNSKTKTITYQLTRSEFDIELLEKQFVGVFKEKNMGRAPFDLATFKRGSYEGTKELSELLPGIDTENANLRGIGDFSFQVIFAKNMKPNNEDIKRYPYKTVDYRERSEWLKKFGGIRIFRDNFRVRPYGENGDDWLRLGERQAQSPGGVGQRMGGYRVRPNQVTGSIYISRLENHALQDKSSREGIVENDSFDLLKNIIRAMLSIVESDRNTTFYSLSQLAEKTNQVEMAKQEGKRALAVVVTESEKKEEEERTYSKEDTEKVFEYAKILELQEHDKDEEIRILRSLASAGIITAAASHELKTLKNHMSVRSGQFAKLLEKHLNRNDFVGQDALTSPFERLNQMAEADKKVVSWLDYALMPLKRDRRTRSKVNVEEYLKTLTEVWQPLLLTRKIKIEINQDIPPNTLVRMFPIDMDTIFNNLIINSMEAFSSRKKIQQRIIKISANYDSDNLDIDYEDNAGGLDASLLKNPDSIFMPHVTTKINARGEAIGTGMGMYLIKAILDDKVGSINIETEKQDSFKVRIKVRAYVK